MKSNRDMGWPLGSGQDVLKLGDTRIHLSAAGNDSGEREGSLIQVSRDSERILVGEWDGHPAGDRSPFLVVQEGRQSVCTVCTHWLF